MILKVLEVCFNHELQLRDTDLHLKVNLEDY